MFEVGLAHAHPDEPEHVDPGGGGGASQEQSDRARGGGKGGGGGSGRSDRAEGGRQSPLQQESSDSKLDTCDSFLVFSFSFAFCSFVQITRLWRTIKQAFMS